MYILYGSESCILCKRAKKILNENKLSFNYIDVSSLHENEYQNLKEKTNNSTSLPFVFKNNEFLGGFSDLQEDVIDNLTFDWE